MKRWTLGVGLAWMVAASAAFAQEESCWTQAQWDAAYVQAAATMGLPYDVAKGLAEQYPDFQGFWTDLAKDILSAQVACPEPAPEPEGPAAPSNLEQAILAFVNDPETSQADLHKIFPKLSDPGVNVYSVNAFWNWRSTIVSNILKHRAGADGKYGTADDNPFDSVRELYEVFGVGTQTMMHLEKYVKAHSPLDLDSAILKLVNDPATGVATLDKAAGLMNLAALNLVAIRSFGPDVVEGTSDDVFRPYLRVFGESSTYESVDSVPYVGPATIQKLFDFAMSAP